jgi:hypothetical protein
VSGGRFLATMDVVIFELPVELRRYFSALKPWQRCTAGRQESVSNKCDGI